MSRLLEAKKWFYLSDAAEVLTILLEGKISVDDVLQFILTEDLVPSWIAQGQVIQEVAWKDHVSDEECLAEMQLFNPEIDSLINIDLSDNEDKDEDGFGEWLSTCNSLVISHAAEGVYRIPLDENPLKLEEFFFRVLSGRKEKSSALSKGLMLGGPIEIVIDEDGNAYRLLERVTTQVFPNGNKPDVTLNQKDSNSVGKGIIRHFNMSFTPKGITPELNHIVIQTKDLNHFVSKLPGGAEDKSARGDAGELDKYKTIATVLAATHPKIIRSNGTQESYGNAIDYIKSLVADIELAGESTHGYGSVRGGILKNMIEEARKLYKKSVRSK